MLRGKDLSGLQVVLVRCLDLSATIVTNKGDNPSCRQRKGNDQGNRAPNRSKRMRAIVESAIIVLKALVAFLELIRIFLT
ncbi:damage-inducible type I toxin DinQ [Candidatus Symbiopectobacterium sp. NZEC151]|uniref:damage-inducible type I toxin DinQ n=1 Tax=Candidatus Symbiopectobacterium sp. NZEC151 TaxID=2820470 RepID=UPI0034DABFF5